MARILLSMFAAALFVPSVACAHFPFVHLKSDDGRSVLHVYFAETAEPDDPALLDRLAGAEVWRLVASGSPQPIEVQKGSDSLVAEVSGTGPAAYGLTKDYGVISRGGETFRLAYYAKTFSGPDGWTIETSKPLRLDLVPTRDGEELTLTALWDGKPLADAEIVLQGGIESLEGKTGTDGRFTCRLTDPDLYSIRVKHVEDAAGELEGKTYESVRHYATLTLELK